MAMEGSRKRKQRAPAIPDDILIGDLVQWHQGRTKFEGHVVDRIPKGAQVSLEKWKNAGLAIRWKAGSKRSHDTLMVVVRSGIPGHKAKLMWPKGVSYVKLQDGMFRHEG